MNLVGNTYGKARVRIMRVHRDGDRHEVRELSLSTMVQGDFARTYTHADNSKSLCTDTMKNLVNIVARENPALGKEAFCAAVADRLLAKYPQVATADVTGYETKWTRLTVKGRPHPHSFVLDGNGKPFARVSASRDAKILESGVSGFTFLKSTQSGWEKYYKDDYTTLEETQDRLCATSMDAAWRWQRHPADFEAANANLLDTMLAVFATTYSASMQDSLYRMAAAGLETVPEVAQIHLACPNKHYIPIDFSSFGLAGGNAVYLPTDEPHGQIECRVGRG